MSTGSSRPVPPYYRGSLARIHHLGFGFHADLCAPGILAILEAARISGGCVVELGCGSGLLTKHLVCAGHRVIATDASGPMLDIARDYLEAAAGGAGAGDVGCGSVELRTCTLPDDPIPPADAIVSVGHVLNYLPDEEAIDRALVSAAAALRPGGVLAIDLCDLEWGAVRRDAPAYVRREEDWVLVTEFAVPGPDRFVRTMTTFVRDDDGCWRRDDERHDNVLVDTARVPTLLAAHDVDAVVARSFGSETLPTGLVTIVGTKKPDG